MTRPGLNLFNPAWVINRTASGITSELQENGTIHLTGTASSSNRYVQSNDFLCLPAGTYRIRGNPVEATARKNQVKIDSNGVFTVDGKELINFTVRFTIGDTVDIYESIILTKGSEIIDYEPYNGNTYTIDLDGTRYGGTLDVTTGVLTVTHGYVELSTYTWTQNWSSGTPTGVFHTQVISYAKASGDLICDSYKVVRNISPNAMGNGCIIMYNNARLYITNTDYTDGTALKSSLSGKYAVYELATPQTVQLTPTEVETVYKNNNVWANSGDIKVLVYRMTRH